MKLFIVFVVLEAVEAKVGKFVGDEMGKHTV